jgi:hypothetical protein
VTDERTQELRGDPATEPDSTSGQFRVVLDGIGDHTGTLATEPTDRSTALTDFDTILGFFTTDVAAGRLRISVLAEDVWEARAQR